MGAFQYIAMAAAVLFCVAYGVISLLRGGAVTRYALFFALMVTAATQAFDLLSVLPGADFLFWKKFSLVSESLLPVSWLLFSVTFSRKTGPRSVSIMHKAFIAASLAFPAAALYLPLDGFFYSPDFEAEKMLFLGSAGFVFYIGVFIYMVAAAINMEATLKMAPRSDRWKIKFETIGAGALIAMLIFYYSQGFLYRAINMNFLGARALAVCISVGLMAYSRFTRGNGVKVHVSKDMAYRSVVIIIIGLYLITLGLIGEGMRYFGASVQRNILIGVVFLSGILLLAALLSETLKRKMKVFLHKNFYSNKYDYRAQWLDFTRRLSSPRSDAEMFTAILSGFCEIFGLKGAVLVLSDDDKASYTVAAIFEMGSGKIVFARDSAIVRRFDSDRSILSLREVHRVASLGDEGTRLMKMGVSFVVPLLFNDTIGGFILLGSPISDSEIYTYEDYDLMKTLSSQAASTILNLRLSDELSRAREMEAIGKVSAFVLHDLKNLASTLSLMAVNAKDFISEPEFQRDMLSSLGVTVEKMKGLISRLKNLREKRTLRREVADLSGIVYDTVKMVGGDVEVSASPVYSDVDKEEIQKVVLNLVLNAMEASGPGGGAVSVEVGVNGHAYIAVRDSGCGMSEDFIRNRLFKPFQTTKKKGIGIGLYQCRHIVEAHGGSIDVKSGQGEGAEFTVSLPIVDCPNEAAGGLR